MRWLKSLQAPRLALADADVPRERAAEPMAQLVLSAMMGVTIASALIVSAAVLLA